MDRFCRLRLSLLQLSQTSVFLGFFIFNLIFQVEDTALCDGGTLSWFRTTDGLIG